jgi:hypothetical protein
MLVLFYFYIKDNSYFYKAFSYLTYYYWAIEFMQISFHFPIHNYFFFHKHWLNIHYI